MGKLRESLASIQPSSDTSKVRPKLEPLPVKHNPYLHDLVWTLLKPHPAGKLLDIPAGPGYFAQQAQANGFQAVAAEIDQSLHIFPEVSYQTVDMSKELPFPINSFDYIVSIEGIEHIENQFLFIRECNRILKRGGKLFLTTPNSSSLESRLLFFITPAHQRRSPQYFYGAHQSNSVSSPGNFFALSRLPDRNSYHLPDAQREPVFIPPGLSFCLPALLGDL